MSSDNYELVTQWRVQGTVQEVAEILTDVEDLARWWPAVCRDIRVLDPGDVRGLGRVVDLYTRGRLPSTSHWRFQVTDVRDDGFTADAWGDLNGRGVWSFEQDGPWTNVTCHWTANPNEGPALRLTPLTRPLFDASYRWAMEKGEESLRLELARRHARTPEQANLIPPPPSPAAMPVKPLLLGAASAALLGIFVRARRRG